MQLTLEPALHLFDADPVDHDASPFGAGFGQDRPADDMSARGMLLSSDTIRLAEQTAGKLAAAQPGTRSVLQNRWLSVAGYAAALLVGMGLAFAASMSGRLHDDGTPGLLPDDGISSRLPEDGAKRHNDNVDDPARMLSAGCIRQAAASFGSSEKHENEEAVRRSESARRTVVLACVACHLDSTTTQ